MKISLSLLVVIFCLVACNKEMEIIDPPPAGENLTDSYLVFGHFYGFCQGETCIEIFKLENEKLYQDTVDSYPNRDDFYVAEFKLEDNSLYQEASALLTGFPGVLYDNTNSVYGSPDTADQGGLYIERFENGERHFWILDNFNNDFDNDIKEYMKKIHEIIEKINS